MNNALHIPAAAIVPAATGQIGLEDLAAVPLTPANQEMLEAVGSTALGPAPWQQRKRAELREILALTQIVPRQRVILLGAHAVEDLELLLAMNVPVPCMAPGDSQLQVGDHAVLSLRYPQQVLTQDLPGTSFARIRQPRFVWHSNVHFESGTMCLGGALPRNIPFREVVWLCYASLSMQSVMLDIRDSARVANAAAARWWVANQDRRPLTKTAFLQDQDI